jgi:hypothetical protein
MGNDYSDLCKVMDWLDQGTLFRHDRASKFCALAAMSACISATYCSPVGRGGLNQYMQLVMGSGVGKERYTLGAKEIVAAISPFLVARKKPKSDSGLYRMLQKNSSQLFVFDEIGSWMKAMIGSNISSQQLISTVFLEAWSCPQRIDGSANKFERDSMDEIFSPSISIIGGMTIETFEKLSKMDAFKEDGLHGRFETIIIKDIIIPNRTMNKISLQDNPMLEPFAEATRKALDKISKAIKIDKEGKDYLEGVDYGEKEALLIEPNALDHWQEIMQTLCIEGQKIGGLFGAIMSRTPQRIMRTSSALCFFRGKRTINIFDIDEAFLIHNENLSALEPYAKIAEANNENERNCLLILDTLKKLGGKGDSTAMRKATPKLSKITTRVLAESFTTLQDGGELLIYPDPESKGIKKRIIYELIKKEG